VEHGGSLNFFHIESLVSLITINASNAWEEALAIAIEEDEVALAGLESSFAAAGVRAAAEGIAAAVNAALATADGDAAIALTEAIFQISRVDIAEQVGAELGEDLAAAEAANDETAIEQIEAQIVDREAEILDSLVVDALSATSGDPFRALTRAHAEIAERGRLDAETTLDAAIANVEAGRPIQQVATPIAITQGTCGQR
jgi:hypothetical protein